MHSFGMCVVRKAKGKSVVGIFTGGLSRDLSLCGNVPFGLVTGNGAHALRLQLLFKPSQSSVSSVRRISQPTQSPMLCNKGQRCHLIIVPAWQPIK